MAEECAPVGQWLAIDEVTPDSDFARREDIVYVLDSPIAAVSKECEPGQLDLFISVVHADDGPGIPEAEREHAFEAGHSTAENGTGFGLAIVTQIAKAHGWEIRETTSEAGGARFEITGVEIVD